MSETRFEADVHDIKTVLTRLEPMLAGINAQIPHLATKADLATTRADLADKPSRLYMWGVIAALLAGQAVILAAATLLPKLV